MKRIVVFIITIALVYSCDHSNTTQTKSTNEGTNQPGIENVNGNIPETQNSISLDTRDSTAIKDSITP